LNRELGIPLESIAVLSNGVELARFRVAAGDTRRRIRSTLRIVETAFVVGTVGSLTPVKGHRVLISAVARAARFVPHIHLVVVGSGPLHEDLIGHARAERIGDRVHFAGQREDVPDLLTAMDAYVCSSESEGMSNALLEAMASGRPIVATDVGDNAAIVREKVEGLIVPSDGIESLATAIMRLASTPALRNRFAAASRVRAENYNFARTVRAYELWYASLLTGPQPRPHSNEPTALQLDVA
jgi:glycosyltransferase involved in cell wall biosynthesis